MERPITLHDDPEIRAQQIRLHALELACTAGPLLARAGNATDLARDYERYIRDGSDAKPAPAAQPAKVVQRALAGDDDGESDRRPTDMIGEPDEGSDPPPAEGDGMPASVRQANRRKEKV